MAGRNRFFGLNSKRFTPPCRMDAGLTLLNLPTQYRHFVAWQRTWLVTPAADEQRRYWRAQLEGLTELPLRTDRHRPEIATGRGARYPFKLSQQLSHDLESLGRTNSTTLYMTLLAAFQCLLYRYTQHEDVIVGSLVANRTHLATEPLIGMFANAVALRTNLTGDPQFTDVLQRVRQVTLEADRNQELPVEEVLRMIAAPRTEGKNTLFRVMFLFAQFSKTPALPGVLQRLSTLTPVSRAPIFFSN